jgi:hypothetical protein
VTEEWQTIVVGRQGPAGVVQADLPPLNTDVLWIDTDEEGAELTFDDLANVVAPLTYDVGTQTVGSDGSLLVTVEHGGDDSEPRPSYAATVYWKGTVAPVNGANGDLWYDSTGDV